jgi:hypothetical protein
MRREADSGTEAEFASTARERDLGPCAFLLYCLLFMLRTQRKH